MIISFIVVSMAGTMPTSVFGQAVKTTTPLKIGIIGSGNIGSTLGDFWAKAGHQVLFSSRNPENLKALVEKVGPQARAGTVKDAIAFGDVILIAVPYGSMPQIAKDYAKDLAGKIVMDTGNAVLARDGEIAKEAREKGVGLTTQRLLPGARVVRAFNTLGVSRLKNDANRCRRPHRYSHGRRRSRSVKSGVHACARRRFRSGGTGRARSVQNFRANQSAVWAGDLGPGDDRTSESDQIDPVRERCLP